MNWNDKVVLVTGGTGSFGKKFIEIMLKEYHPAKIIIFSRDELKQHEMRINGYDDPSLRYFIGDIRDLDRLKRACEYNPFEAIKTNILGSQNVIDAALDCGVKKVLAISTDKAVNPVNLYGVTKLGAEKLFIQSNSYAGAHDTRFSCTRYGNVVGSRGSVVPVFLQQRKTGKLTVTDERMTRFWISLEQGVRFVIRCIEQMHGGEVFVPKIPSMSVKDLGAAIAPECEIVYSGIRPGEKLHEVLVSEDEARSSVELEDMFVVQPTGTLWFGKEWEKIGKKLPEGFRYASNTNTEWLDLDGVKEMIRPFQEAYEQGK